MKTKTTRLFNRWNGTRRESSIFHNNVLIMFPALDSILLCHFFPCCSNRRHFCLASLCMYVFPFCSCIVSCISILYSMHTGCHFCLLQFTHFTLLLSSKKNVLHFFACFVILRIISWLFLCFRLFNRHFCFIFHHLLLRWHLQQYCYIYNEIKNFIWK